jgi:predicted alpha/beta hydrolase family esterase
MATSSKPKKAIIIPGNGFPDNNNDIGDMAWYGWLADALRGRGIEVETFGFPDPLYAHEAVWIQHCTDVLGMDDTTLVIGHSSGSACALRIMERFDVAGCMLVAAYDTDLGDAVERESGYFSRPFDYAKMRAHCPWVLQFHSRSDQLVPVASGRRVSAGLKSEYTETNKDGHFQELDHAVLLEKLTEKLDSL